VQPSAHPTRPTAPPTVPLFDYIAVNFSFTLQDIDRDILRAHKRGDDQPSYERDKHMVVSALSDASGLSSSVFDASSVHMDMDADIDPPGLRARAHAQLGRGSAVVSMQGRIFAKALNSSVESAEAAILQLQRMVQQALSGGADSAFLALLKDKYMNGSSLDNYKPISSTDIVKVKIFTSATVNSAVTDMDGFVVGSAL